MILVSELIPHSSTNITHDWNIITCLVESIVLLFVRVIQWWVSRLDESAASWTAKCHYFYLNCIHIQCIVEGRLEPRSNQRQSTIGQTKCDNQYTYWLYYSYLKWLNSLQQEKSDWEMWSLNLISNKRWQRKKFRKKTVQLFYHLQLSRLTHHFWRFSFRI